MKRKASCIIGVMFVSLASCSSEPTSLGPPMCEPPEELVIERTLKQGYKALSQADLATSEQAFEEVLALAPEHPQAKAGLYALGQAKTRGACDGGQIWIDGQAVESRLVVEAQRLRFEVRKQWRETAQRQRVILENKATSLPDSYGGRSRTSAGDAVDADRNDNSGMSAVNLAVLHASHTQNAVEAFVRAEGLGQAFHFLIDYNGTLYQSLDLGSWARHSGVEEIDKRSIAIMLVNPLRADKPPLPSGVSGLRRALSERSAVHEDIIRAWGYTAPQKASLSRLLRELPRVLTGLPATIPKAVHGLTTTLPNAQLASIEGVIGGHHVDRTSWGPGPAMDWRELAEGLAPLAPSRP